MPDRIYGSLTGLSALERAGLGRLYHHISEPREIASEALATRMAALAGKLRRQVGVLIDRNGHVTHVLVGDDHALELPDLGRWGRDSARLRGLRLVHIHLKGEALNDDDANDCVRLGLDLVCAIGLRNDLPDVMYVGHIAADSQDLPHHFVQPFVHLPVQNWAQDQTDCAELIRALEQQLGRTKPLTRMAFARESALLIHVGPEPLSQAEDRMDEMEELAKTAQVEIVGRVIQRRQQVDARTLLGAGKLSEISLKAMQSDATMLLFARELTPSQSKNIGKLVEMKVLDRTQLILDIFARRARSQDGKLQVELAQLRYQLPRLGDRDNALSRLTGGIGGVGPGETKLEIDRRRCRDRVHRLEDELKRLAKGRATRRHVRVQSEIASATLIGYTNVGKSSLLNAVAKSDAYTENLLFATLDPTSRRLRLPGGTPLVLTDTVGFIRELPKELLGAFEATLEEARAADVLVLVLDASHPQVEMQLASLEKIFADVAIADKPRLVVLNKSDAVTDPPTIREIAAQQRALMTSTVTREGLAEFLNALESQVLSARAAAKSLDNQQAEVWSPLAE